jgi:hypothetical protein
MNTDKSVQGAADKILGILNPEEGQSEPTTKVEPSEEAQPEAVETQQEAPVEAAQESNQSETEEVTEEAQASENQETNENETELQEEIEKPSLHRVKVNGQELEVSLDELKSGYSRDSDYRQKTHSLSLERKNLEEEKNVLRQTYDTRIKELDELMQSANSFISQGSEVDLKAMYEEDPQAAAKLDFQMRQQREYLASLRQKSEAVKQQQYNQFLNEQKQLAEQAIPELANPQKASEIKVKMRDTLSNYGFNDQEIGSLADHRFLLVLKDAIEYRNLKNAKPIVQKKVVNAPKVVKSGTAKTESSKRSVIQSKLGRLKKSGKIQDAHSAILEIISKK